MKTINKHLLPIVLIIFLGITPLLLVFSASIIAQKFGCRLDEAGSYPCIIAGRDIGEGLSSMFVMGWFSLITIPGALICLASYIMIMIILSIKKSPDLLENKKETRIT